LKQTINVNTYPDPVVPQSKRTRSWKCIYKTATVEKVQFYIAGHKGLSKIYIMLERRGGIVENLAQNGGVEYFTGNNIPIELYLGRQIEYGDRLVIQLVNDDPDTTAGIAMNLGVQFGIESTGEVY